MLVTGVLIALGTVLAIQGWVETRRAARQAARVEGSAPDTVPKKSLFVPRELQGIAILALSFWLYVFLIKYLGYLITTPIFLFLFLLQYGDRKWLRMILVSVITTAATWVLFVYAFRIFLPDFYFL
jgi:hypothetical protein